LTTDRLRSERQPDSVSRRISRLYRHDAVPRPWPAVQYRLIGSFVIILWAYPGPSSIRHPIPIYGLGRASLCHRRNMADAPGRTAAGILCSSSSGRGGFPLALVRIRENMESIALYRGELEEGVTLRERFMEVSPTGGRS